MIASSKKAFEEILRMLEGHERILDRKSVV